MKLDSEGRLLFLSVCFMQQYYTESFNWTLQPANPTSAIKGEDKSLTWKFNLTADEQTKKKTFYFTKWKKFNQTSSDYDLIASITFFKIFGTVNYNEPRAPHIEIVRSDQATLLINNVRKEDEGTYKFEYSVDSDGTLLADHGVNVTVLEPSEIVNVSKNQDVCEGSMVALSCNATGKPAPNITWTRKWENGTDSEELPSVDGYHPIYNIGRSSNGTYCCTAFNGVGDPVNQTVEVIVRYSPSVDGVVGSPNTATEGRQYNLTCNVSWDPQQNVSWIKVSNDKHTVGSLLQFNNISRNDAGDYKCVASNRCGNDSKTEAINVLYKPTYVILEKNATENKDCFDLWVNFNCTSSKANPPVYNYLLLKNGAEFTSSKIGTWTEKISEGGKAIYSCIANQSVENVSSESITLTVNVPPSVKQIKIEPITEGDPVEMYCNATGSPNPTVKWTKGENVVSDNSSLIIENISRNEAGDYRCTANNTCGNASTVVYVDVRYKPENVVFNSNLSSKEVCAGVFVNLTCTADANPPVHTYLLYENDVVIQGPNNTGIWMRRLDKSGNFTYRCKVNTSFPGIEESKNLTFTVRVPPSFRQASKKSGLEGSDIKVYCNATGIPNPTVWWTKVNDVVSNTSLLTFLNISRDKAGEYQCIASNTCENTSAMVYIDVQYKPERSGPTEATPFENEPFDLECPMTGNPLPEYNWVSDDGRTKTGKTWSFQRMESRDSGSYTCLATNDVGNGTVVVSVQVVSVETTHRMQVSIDKNETDASKRNSTCETFAEVACSVLPNCVDNVVVYCGNGSIVVEFLLKFSTDVTVNEVISNLTKAVDQGKFGSLPVDTSSLRSLSPSSSTTATEPTSTMVTTTKVPECEEAIFKKKNCETKWVNVSVIIVASVVVIVVVVVITCCLHKKRKCRKHTKVKNSDGQPLSSNHSTLSDSNPFAKDNCGYHKSGPQPTVEIENEQSVEAMGGEPIPAYAMVDKSKKKDKKKNREAAEQKLTEDQYAVVDKSKKKKKKKNEQDNTYAEVDMSRTSKKKQKPGEVFYADLDEFQQMQKMPKVSTSPEPLPPIKRPEAYGETQYADITQFLKGNPDTGAVLPKDSTTAAVSNTATGSKEESSAGNTGDHSEATNETGF